MDRSEIGPIHQFNRWLQPFYEQARLIQQLQGFKGEMIPWSLRGLYYLESQEMGLPLNLSE